MQRLGAKKKIKLGSEQRALRRASSVSRRWRPAGEYLKQLIEGKMTKVNKTFYQAIAPHLGGTDCQCAQVTLCLYKHFRVKLGALLDFLSDIWEVYLTNLQDISYYIIFHDRLNYYQVNRKSKQHLNS